MKVSTRLSCQLHSRENYFEQLSADWSYGFGRHGIGFRIFRAARAWGCIAVSEEGSYGYSYNYDNQGDASDRALSECAAKTTTESTCEITECIEGS